MSLTVLLSSSSFFLEKNLNDKMDNQTIDGQELTYALKQGFDFAHLAQMNHSVEGDTLWLISAKKLAPKNGDVAYKLAYYYKKQQQLTDAVYWYKQAIKQQNLAAHVALASYYFTEEKLALARDVLIKVPQKNNDIIVLKAKIAIALGDIQQIYPLLDDLLASKIGRLLNSKMQHYQVIMPSEQTGNIVEHCSLSLQLFATTLEDLDKLSKMKQAFKKHPLSAAICLTVPRYISRKKVSCLYDENQAIRCDESMWKDISNTINTRYVGLMLPKGGANVHYGILYLDRHDTVEVFAHEVSHLVGFIDEYALPTNHPTCIEAQKAPFSHNIVVLAKAYKGEKEALRKAILAKIPWAAEIKKTTPIFIQKGDKWLLSTSEEFAPLVGVYPSETCEQEGFMAFKPVNERTLLRYFQYPFPLLYQKLLLKHKSKFSMPSFHYNIAFAFYKNKKLVQATFWLEQAANLEDNKKRKFKILQGDF
jgi:tetratricopeptide (TPR) repeat protein